MNAAEALAWALVHFLWQGAALAAGCWLTLNLLRSPEARYTAACAALGLMAVAPVATLLVLLGPAPAAASFAAPLSGWQGTLPVEFDIPWTARLLAWLPAAWACGAALLLGRSAAAWWLARARTLNQLRPASAALRGSVAALARRMNVPRAVRVFESATACTPQVFGWLRPMLLLPAAAVAGLSPGQLEAVIAHELAHVRRHDYLVNLLQTVVESLLYYHPAVWWVSSRIRVERELCCDEAAVALCGDRVLYSRALLQLEESRVEFAMAAGAGLKHRIGRILGMKEQNTLMAPALALSAALILGGGLVWARQNPAPPTPPAAPAPAVAPAPPDTVVVDGKVYRKKTLVPKPASPAAPHQPVPPPPPPPPAGASAVEADELRALDMQMRALEQQMRELAERRRQLQRQTDAYKADAKSLEREKYEYEKQLSEIERQAQKQARSAERVEAEAKVAEMLARQKQMELERRIRYADERFKEDGKRGSETDRGKVYLKYGPPDEIETHSSEGRDAWLYRNGPIIRFQNGKLVSIDAAI